MNEEFLHYLWQFRLLSNNLSTVDGDRIMVLHPGEHNKDSGPDFFNAQIRIGDTLWAGNVEIHVKSSDWFRHHHEHDQAYDNVILHVVFNDDLPKKELFNKPFPTLVVKDSFSPTILSRYEDLVRNKRWIACEQLVHEVDPFYFNQWAPSLALDYQSTKIKRFGETLSYVGGDWDETFFRQLFRSFGFRINSHPFELLAKSLSVKLICKYSSNLFQLEALLYGQANLLPGESLEDYPKLLIKEYEFLRDKHQLDPIGKGLWKFLRLRPSNFPTIRIAQLAALLNRQEDLFSIVNDCDSISQIRTYFLVKPSDYWSTHFLFNRMSPEKLKVMGASSADLLILNLIVPFLFFYSEARGMIELKEKALHLMEQLNGEKNAEISKWAELKFPTKNALQTQALTFLKREYCDKKRCLECRLGNLLLKDQHKIQA